MKDLLTFVITGEDGEAIAVLNANNPQELSEKITAALINQYDGFNPEYKHLFRPISEAFSSWDKMDLIVHVHDINESEEECSFYVKSLTIQRCIAF